MSDSCSAIREQPSVAVVGAGVAGLVLAIRLADLGLKPLVFEARSEEAVVREGEFLTLAPNGMNALRTVGCCDAVVSAGIDTRGIELLNERGKLLALADQNDDEREFGAPSITILRSKLTSIMMTRARASGVDVAFQRRVVNVTQDAHGVTLRFGDGKDVTAAYLVGADGLRSDVRRLVFPHYPEPRYSGLIGAGGTVMTDVPDTSGRMRMTFGSNAFFGYIKAAGHPVYWFSSYPSKDYDDGRQRNATEILQLIRDLHACDPSPNPAILRDVTSIGRTYPMFDMPLLPRWSNGRVVLAGDAAHAVGPHAGQGASMAIEDAVVLAACLADRPASKAAFERFEGLRRDRIKQVVKVTARNSSQKGKLGPVGKFVRDLVLPIMVPLGIKAGRKLFKYRVDLAPLGQPST